MIAWLEGVLLEKQPPTLVLNVGGVGYELEVPASTFAELPAINETISLHIHMVVREDAQLLFAFTTAQQRDLFRSLIRVNGVGPKVGLAVLSTMSIQELLQSMTDEDYLPLTRVPGIGKKTAQRLLVEMKDRLPKEFSDVSLQVGGSRSGSSERQDAISALISLGYKDRDASRIIRALPEELSSEDLIRQALRHLSGKVL